MQQLFPIYSSSPSSHRHHHHGHRSQRSQREGMCKTYSFAQWVQLDHAHQLDQLDPWARQARSARGPQGPQGPEGPPGGGDGFVAYEQTNQWEYMRIRARTRWQWRRGHQIEKILGNRYNLYAYNLFFFKKIKTLEELKTPTRENAIKQPPHEFQTKKNETLKCIFYTINIAIPQ